jgi:hypothetical protein
MLKTYQIHVDTALASNVQTGGTAFIYKTNNNPFQCTINLGNRHRAVRTVTLKNAQIPIGFYNVRSPYNTFTLGGVTYTVNPGNYASISALSSASITPSGTYATLGALGTWDASSVTNLITFTPVAGLGTCSFSGLAKNTFLTFLGFSLTQNLTGSSASPIVASYPYLLNWDNYISIWIENLGQSSLEPAQISFKIPLNGITSNVMYWSEGNQNTQVVDVTDRGVRVDRLNVTVLDRFGQIINNNGLDWSFSFDMLSEN